MKEAQRRLSRDCKEKFQKFWTDECVSAVLKLANNRKCAKPFTDYLKQDLGVDSRSKFAATKLNLHHFCM